VPIPKPEADETKDEFIARCLANPTMVNEYPDNGQRYAVCEASWDEQPRSGGWPTINW
jgi:hypothetical protein